jgi:glycosyltransferase involved in cell wall biosynthesis
MEKVSQVKQNVSHLISQLSTTRSLLQDKQTVIEDYDLIVFSHLRWDFVFQRPQHLIERFSQKQRILFVEEPIDHTSKEEGGMKLTKVNKNLTILQPQISGENWLNKIDLLLQKYLTKNNYQKPILWFYSPMFEPLANVISHSLIVYDCMDELAAFKGAPPQLIEREKRLLNKADVVFTGGKSLYESKKECNENVYCFPSSVDDKHFALARAAETSIPKDLAKIPGPRIGFYGVLDERLDLDLLHNVAKRLPDFSFVMIGPVVKISEADLPRRKNIYYLGSKKYEELPRYLKGIDVAMMPFALNEATRFISPTKTLEFMAAFKPIVSTPIKDVVRDYSHEVSIAQSVVEFSLAIEKYLHESASQRLFRYRLQQAVINRTSWDRTAQQMRSILQDSLEQHQYTREVVKNYKPQIQSSPSLALNVSI